MNERNDQNGEQKEGDASFSLGAKDIRSPWSMGKNQVEPVLHRLSLLVEEGLSLLLFTAAPSAVARWAMARQDGRDKPFPTKGNADPLRSSLGRWASRQGGINWMLATLCVVGSWALPLLPHTGTTHQEKERRELKRVILQAVPWLSSAARLWLHPGP